MIAARSFPSRLLEARDEYPGARTFALEAPADFDFVPGMWVMLQLPGAEESRAYSMASSPLDKGRIELSVALAGDFSRRLFALKPGAELGVKGPYGKWLFEDSLKHAVLISEGTGLAPFRSMCLYALGKRLGTRLTLLTSAPDEASLLYKAEYEGWRSRGVEVRASTGGHVTVSAVAAAVPDLLDATFYLCGSNSLVETMTKGLSARGVAREHIRHEKWGDYSS